VFFSGWARVRTIEIARANHVMKKRFTILKCNAWFKENIYIETGDVLDIGEKIISTQENFKI
jgi:hypothetical protein